MGRPTKLNANVQRVIVSAIAKGNTRKVAADAAGVGEPTLYRWLQHGASARAPRQYREFREAVEKAEAEAQMGAVGVIRAAGRTSWQAMSWWLERRYPDEWGRKDRVAIEHLLKTEAHRIAEDLGIEEDAVIAEAERILTGSS